ncbi:MAG: 30S ribosomal protein S17 [Alphaproteobacteria bacterium MarineAlpha5_Bin9]|nr:MAG: 30S ribosomal protein S17 [Alphaproteobacteria bacterium MarineAlpha5_Bin9]|tara:strand:+ start:3097 stop:3342 length:246 start_codon:yes stop_codon:yes gene_type:complete
MPKRILNGKIVSNKNKNTVVVEVIRTVKHEIYKKIIKKNKKFHAHTNKSYEIGTSVSIQESKPISKLKKWVVMEATKEESK